MPRKFSKVRLTRAQFDFGVSVHKISTPRFSTILISVEYLTTGNIHGPGHNALKVGPFSNLLLFKQKVPFLNFTWKGLGVGVGYIRIRLLTRFSKRRFLLNLEVCYIKRFSLLHTPSFSITLSHLFVHLF